MKKDNLYAKMVAGVRYEPLHDAQRGILKCGHRRCKNAATQEAIYNTGSEYKHILGIGYCCDEKLHTHTAADSAVQQGLLGTGRNVMLFILWREWVLVQELFSFFKKG